MFDNTDRKIYAFKVEEKVFIQENTLIAYKTKNSITFTSLIQME